MESKPASDQNGWRPAYDSRTSLVASGLKRAIADHLLYTQAKFPEIADWYDFYMALAYTLRDRLLERWVVTQEAYRRQDARVVAYLSAEYLLGPHIGKSLLNLGITEAVRQVLSELGIDLEYLIEEEPEPGLGNGGLGRLAACFMDSFATLGVPSIGYGLRYEFGIFKQAIREGWQVELTDKWLQFGNPWEVVRPGFAVEVKFGGHTEPFSDAEGKYRVKWIPGHVIKGVPYDTPIIGYGNNRAHTLRLWKAEAVESFDFARFNVGDYSGAVHEKIASETVSEVLYPNDEVISGKTLRLEQQFFFVSCSLQDILRVHFLRQGRLEDLPKKWAIQMNDTHPSIAVAEMMRLLVDEYAVPWEPAWEMTVEMLGYTNHTLMPEALERWPLSIFQSLLPRHLEIIYEINHRFLDAGERSRSRWTFRRWSPSVGSRLSQATCGCYLLGPGQGAVI